ncbi:hypothetical protein ACF3DV_32035 [Chlorogloeopsis fritschii PCC 9212]|uniref:Uncharacterized protein n=1 Tax=Chlorogloeopsis fritschii PCC 6912 TaxID=211165 RepID=A0A3S1FRH2_CHLFR|nr:hypothetical protein [Chlorogloeopsis fritschii]RUR84156.1 hypothetical protein PCC6912_17500 [Chlorogloeopsis fritschii PCC 6912]
MITSTNYQFFCVDFWIIDDYQSEKNGESFVFASNGLDLSIAGFSLINYCFSQEESQVWNKYEKLLKNLAFPINIYGEKIDFLSRNAALILLNEISNQYSWELNCWLQNYIYPSWELQGKIDTPCVTNSSIIFKKDSAAKDLMKDKDDFLYGYSSYHGEVKPEKLTFNAFLQQFSQQVGYICALETNGKIRSEEAYQQIEELWKQLERLKDELGIGF